MGRVGRCALIRRCMDLPAGRRGANLSQAGVAAVGARIGWATPGGAVRSCGCEPPHP